MARLRSKQLSRRERQIMDIVYALGEASAEDVRRRLPNPPGNASVRRQLGILEEKRLLRHRQEGQLFIYEPTVPREEASASAMWDVINTFFGGSMPRAVAAMLSMSASELSREEIEELRRLVATFQEDESNDE